MPVPTDVVVISVIYELAVLFTLLIGGAVAIHMSLNIRSRCKQRKRGQ